MQNAALVIVRTFDDRVAVRDFDAPDGRHVWVGADVCRGCGLSNVSLAINGNPTRGDDGLDMDEKGVYEVNTPSGPQKMLCVTEAGLYSLIFKSRHPDAKRFKRWITHEVLPSIRKTGSYSVEQPANVSMGAAIVQIGQAMMAQERKIAAVETVVEEVKDRLDDAEAERIEIKARVETIEESQPIFPTVSRSRKRQRVYDLLKVPSLAEFSNGRIARMLDVSAQFVGQVRCELERLGIISTAPTRKAVNDRHINIANCGRRLMTNGTA